MNCLFEFTGRTNGHRFIHRCKNCGREVSGKYQDRGPKATCSVEPKPDGKPKPPARPLPPAGGPGTEFVRVTNDAGLRAKGGCNCKSLQAEMDREGVFGCRARREYFVVKLQENAKQFSWLEQIAAGVKLVGEPWFNPLDPLGSMFDEAVRRAAAKLPPPGSLKVAFLAPSLLLGGAERWIASLCSHFDHAKIWPQYIALTEPQHCSAVVEGWLPKFTQVLSADYLPQIMERVDVLISWGTKDLAERTKGATCKLVDVQHGTIGFGQYQLDLAKAAIDSGAELTAVGEACLENFPPEYRDRVTVIQNGAETDRLQPIIGREAKRKELGILPEEKVCLFIGRIARVKNLDGLAAAMALLPGWRLVVAGPEYQKHHCLGAAIVLPSQEQLGDLFAAADVFCAPSHHEANSLSVIESWLAGVPAVTTDYPAAKEMERKHGRMSWLVPINPAPRVLADAIEEAAKWRGTLPIQNVQGIAIKNYTAAAMARRWQEYILSLPAIPQLPSKSG